jgi:hypothetical protein
MIAVSVSVAAVLTLSACMPAPVLTKAELDSKKTPKKHPRMTVEQKRDCRSCHKEAPAIRTP